MHIENRRVLSASRLHWDEYVSKEHRCACIYRYIYIYIYIYIYTHTHTHILTNVNIILHEVVKNHESIQEHSKNELGRSTCANSAPHARFLLLPGLNLRRD
jgi:hypothetical protein